MKIKPFIIFFAIGFVFEPLLAVDYYFSSTEGNDAWAGTLPSPNAGQTNGPKQTLAAAQNFIPTVQAGDRILFKRGDVWNVSSGLGIINHRGQVNSPVVIGSYGTGARPRFSFSQGGVVLRSSDLGPTQHLQFRDISIYRNNSAQGDTGFYLGEGVYALPHHILVSDIEIDGLFASLLVNYAADSVFENSLFHNSLEAGFFNAANNVVIRNNVLENIGDPTTQNYYVHVFYLGGANLLVEGNTVRNCHDAMKVRGCRDTTIRNNIISNCGMGGIHAGGDSLGAILQNVVIEGNTIYETGMGIFIKGESGPGPVQNVTIRNNVLYSKRAGTGGGAIGIGGGNEDAIINGLYIYNNLVYDPRQAGVFQTYSSSQQNIFVRNNIFVKTDFTSGGFGPSRFVHIGSPNGLQGMTFSNNIYSGNGPFTFVDNTAYATLASFQQAYPNQEQQSLSGDPLFVSAEARNFHLVAGSLGIDSGYDVNTNVPTDFDGVTRPQGNGFDIGPFEYSIGGPTNVRPQVNAGANQTITAPVISVTLAGTVTDDGLPNPPAATTVSWSQVSGPGVVTFGNTSSLTTTATFPQPGTYVLRLTANDSALSATDDIQVTFNSDSGSGNQSGGPAVTETRLRPCSNPQNSEERSRIPVCFDVKESGNVSLVIYSRQGKRVRELINGHRDVGEHQIFWDLKDDSGNGVSSGAYTVLFESTGVKQKIKVAVVR